MKRIIFSVVLATVAASLASAQVLSFGFTGRRESWTVPANVYALNLQGWAAGGGIAGGSSAYVAGLLLVRPGQVITYDVGQAAGGVYYNEGVGGRTFGGGGYAYGISDVLAGNGGGGTYVFVDGVLSVAVGAGAGGTRVTIGARNTRGGGGGGTYVGGLPGNNPNVGTATGGTQSSGGSLNGGYLHGGDPVGPGAGGGGGYFGGGGGTNASTSNYSLFPGAGGSSYWGGLSNPVLEDGRAGGPAGDVLPGGSAMPNYVQGVGVGGFSSGGNGRLVLTVSSVPEPSSLLALLGAGVAAFLRRKSFRA